MSPYRIIIAHDDSLVTRGLIGLLEPDYQIIASLDDGRKLVARAIECKPDVVILDVAIPNMNGFDVARQLKKSVPNVKVVFLAMQSSPAHVAAAIQAGASAYVLLRFAVDELNKAIVSALNGHRYFSLLEEEDARNVSAQFVGTRADCLTSRERQVLQLVTMGLSAKDVASLLHISPRTAEFHKRRIMEKLGIRTSADMIRIAIRDHLIEA
jgi:DNA-binding NarL/FixJ family response regulator